MSRTQKVLCLVYGLLAVVALFATWSQNLAYFADGAGPGGFGQFWVDTKVNPAARSVTADIGLFFLAAAVFMVSEARRLRIRFVWLYILFGFLIAISVTFPLFMIARERAEPRDEPLTVADVVTLLVTAVVTLGLTGYVLA
jgi:hypothetical protein